MVVVVVVVVAVVVGIVVPREVATVASSSNVKLPIASTKIKYETNLKFIIIG